MWTNPEATTMAEVPGRVVLVGGGPVGIELGQMMARFGAEVAIVHPRDHLINREDRRVGELIAEPLREGGPSAPGAPGRSASARTAPGAP